MNKKIIKPNKSTKTGNLSKNNEINQNGDILDFLNKYTNLYINSKTGENLSEKTIYNAKIILERFYEYVADELDENDKV